MHCYPTSTARKRRSAASTARNRCAKACERSRARQDNIDALARVTPSEWTRRGLQQGVGPVSLGDIPIMMLEHDAGHRAEIIAWCAHVARHGANLANEAR